MLRRELKLPPEYVYPPDEWCFVEERFYPRYLGESETLFSLANGYLGLRGTPEEGEPAFQSGTFINAFHETWPIVYGEDAHGFARVGQTMLNVTDAKIIRLYVDDEPLYLPTANLLRFRRVLNMKEGVLEREVLWEMPSGKRVSVRSRRIISFEHRHLAEIQYEVTLLDSRAPVVLVAEVRGDQPNQTSRGDPRQARGFAGRVLWPRSHSLRERRIILSHGTERSGMTLACGVDHTVDTACPYSVSGHCAEDHAQLSFAVEAEPGRPIRLTKFIAYHTSRRAPAQELCARAERTLDRALGQGFDAVADGQRAWLARFWERADVEVEVENPKVQQAVRWSLFQIAQASGRVEGAGIPAKGLTGQTYEGHYFWDTEIYLLPMLTYTEPRIARNLLKFRHSMLEKARERARDVNQKGALFPWRTINGEEASAYYAAGTAQYHINADIMHALRKYVEATGDRRFLFGEGAEMLVETARLWLDLGFFSKRKGGRFSINEVTGPDEYNTVVDNNTYTNLMARENLRFAADTVEALRAEDPKGFLALVDRTHLSLSEVEAWRRASDSMYIPYDEELGIHPQDDDFLNKRPWDFENTPNEQYPLLLHYHPLVIYRHQVIKQADIVLAMCLLGEEFSEEQKRRNFDFYDPLTTGDSSLSVCIQSIVAAELGYMEKAVEYFQYALLMDVADVAGNVKEGVHMACAGGVWMGIVLGFGGLRDHGGRPRFHPRLPPRCGGVRFRLQVRDARLEVDFRHDRSRYRLLEGEELVLEHAGQELRLTRAEPMREVPPPL